MVQQKNCKNCNAALVKTEEESSICQFCTLTSKIENEIENLRSISAKSSDPDVLRQLTELELMRETLQNKKEEKTEVETVGNTSADSEDLSFVDIDDVTSAQPSPAVQLSERGDADDDSEYQQSLPPGWKVNWVRVRFGKHIKNFSDAAGKKYFSRIDAIRALSGAAGREAELATLRAGLAADGWIQHFLLPADWFAKPVQPVNKNNGIKFLTESNEWLCGLSKVVKYMKNSKDHTEVELENLETFASMFSEVGKRHSNLASEKWQMGEDFLPVGWRYRTVTGNMGDYHQVMSPDGQQFKSKVKALSFMIQNKFDSADVAKMRSGLVYDGWLESENYLPKDWRYRKCKSDRNEYNFLSPLGVMFASRKNVIAHMREERYTEMDITNIEALCEELRSKWTNEQHDWNESDPSVPQGWKTRYFDGVKANLEPRERMYIMSPSGLIFQSRVKALQFMIQNSHEAHQVTYMREQLAVEDWIVHPELPADWLMKRKSGGLPGHQLFTDGGIILDGLKSALSHMQEYSDKFTIDDCNAMVTAMKEMSKDAVVKNYKWTTGENIPNGWQLRQVVIRTLKNKKGKKYFREYFKSPEGRTIKGRINTIQFLLGEGRTLDDPVIDCLRKGLSKVGWEEDLETLPAGWLKKELQMKPGKYKYVSPEFREFGNLVTVFKNLKASNVPSADIQKVKAKLDVKSLLSYKRISKNVNNWSSYKWSAATFLPPDWKTAEKKYQYGRVKHFFLSPSGLILKEAVLALQLMVEEGAEQKYIDLMHERLQQEGWKEDTANLPSGWKYNTFKNTFPEMFGREEEIIFLNEQAQLFNKIEATKVVINECPRRLRYSFSNFLDQLKNKVEDDDFWRDFDVPGWKIKDLDLSFKKEFRVRSPDLLEFNSIAAAYRFMMKSRHNYTEEELYKVKSRLHVEGFETDTRLPAGWMIARNKNELLFEFLSSEGVQFLTLQAALEFMETSEDYNDSQAAELDELAQAEVLIYMQSRGQFDAQGGFVPNIKARGRPVNKIKNEWTKRQYSF